jgi:hypothetical protein
MLTVELFFLKKLQYFDNFNYNIYPNWFFTTISETYKCDMIAFIHDNFVPLRYIL